MGRYDSVGTDSIHNFSSVDNRMLAIPGVVASAVSKILDLVVVEIISLLWNMVCDGERRENSQREQN